MNIQNISYHDMMSILHIREILPKFLNQKYQTMLNNSLYSYIYLNPSRKHSEVVYLTPYMAEILCDFIK